MNDTLLLATGASTVMTTSDKICTSPAFTSRGINSAGEEITVAPSPAVMVATLSPFAVPIILIDLIVLPLAAAKVTVPEVLKWLG